MGQFVLQGESEEYREKRNALLAEEMALREHVERVAALRRELPVGKRMPEYIFREGPRDLSRNDAQEMHDVMLADLFTDGHDTLIVDHLMFGVKDNAPCIMCSMWADGYSAIAPHIEQRANFVVVAKAEISKVREWGKRRRWDHIRLLSSHDNTFNQDMGMETGNHMQQPGLSVFTKTPEGAVYHRYSISAEFDANTNRGIDLYTPVWNLLDLTPEGRGEWYPSHPYMELANAA